MEKFFDRVAAGILLAEELKAYTNRSDVLVLALPRGGVPVACEIAKALSVPLDVFIVRKLGVPGHEELAMGAIATNGATVFNADILQNFHLSKAAIDQVMLAEQAELKRREKLYRGDRPFPDLAGKLVILVDDGIATGATIRAAIKALRQMNPANIVVAVPVAAPSICEEIGGLVERLVCPLRPPYFNSVGAWYANFPQTTDEEVFDCLKQQGRKI